MRLTLTLLGATAVWLLMMTGPVRAEAEQQRPNFVFIITDDISWNDLGAYGHPTIKTPHLDRLAEEGRVFHNAYLTISSCSPSRCSIITGRYPHNTGAPELHTNLPEGQFVFPAALREAGYYTALSGKHHMGPNVNHGFDDRSGGGGPSRSEDWVQVLRDRPKDRPFFLWLASADAHRGWQLNDQAPQYEPEDVVVPPYLVDGPRTRRDLAEYYHEVSRTDHFTGQIVKELQRQGVGENTYVIYISDNGRPFPRGKTYLYDSGIKTPMIISRPGTIEPGRTESLVSSIDIAATVLDLAGLPAAEQVQGVSFAPVLADPEARVRDYAFAERNWHVYQAHERLVRHGPWVYIRNAWPEQLALSMESDPSFPAGEELWEHHEKGQLTADQQQLFAQPRPAEQLFNVEDDPHQLDNLAEDPARRDTLDHLRSVLNRWAEQTGDTIPADPTPDRQDPQGNRDPDFARGEMPGEATNATEIHHPGPLRR